MGFFDWFGRLFLPDSDDSPAQVAGRIVFVAAAAGGLGLAATLATYPGEARAVVLLWALAPAALGAMLGFLFAVPRPRSGGEAKPAEAGAPEAYQPSPIDQIADWLTKIIVGVGLVEYAAIRDALWRTARFIGQGLGGRDRDVAVALAGLLYFSTLGLLTAYLSTRLYLNRALGAADRQTDEERKIRDDVARQVKGMPSRGLEAVAAVKPVAARIGRLRVGHETMRDLVTRLASDYERQRATMPSGPTRTARLAALVNEMRALAEAGAPLLGELMQSPSPGERMVAVAFLGVRPDAAALPWLAERFGVERLFVQYQAAVALRAAAEHLDGPRLTDVLEAIDEARRCARQGGALVDAARDAMLAQAEERARERLRKAGVAAALP
jgi:hypothetical protein